MTRRNMWGVYYPDGREWSIEQALRISRGGSTVMHHFMAKTDPAINLHRFAENDGVLWKLRHGWRPHQDIDADPDRLIAIRCFMLHDFTVAGKIKHPAREYARRMVDHLATLESPNHSAVDAWTWENLAVYFANEPNLHPENDNMADAGQQWKYSRVDHYKMWAAWQMEVFEEVHRLRPDRRCLLMAAPLAQGHDPRANDGSLHPVYGKPDGEWEIPEVAALMAHPLTDLIGANTYGHMDRNGGADCLRDPDRLFGLWRPLRPVGWKNENEPGDQLPDPGGLVSQIAARGLRAKAFFPEIGTFAHDQDELAEINVAALRDFLRACAKTGQVAGANLFIWNSDSKHSGNRIWYSERMRNLLEAEPPIWAEVDMPKPGGATSPRPPAPRPVPPVGGDMTTRLANLLRAEFGDDFRDLRGQLPTRDDSPWPFPRRDPASVSALTVHHTATPTKTTWHEVAQHHVTTKRWSGIGYMLGIRSGRVTLHHGAGVVCWHDNDNYPSIGVALMGNHEVNAPSERNTNQLRRLVRVLDEWRASYGLAPLAIRGHREVPAASTVCPGRHLMPLLPGLRDETAPGLADVLREAGAGAQVLQLNPGAALQKAIFADGYVPVSSEFDSAFDGDEYVGQRAEHLEGRAARVYYVKRGEWHDVRHV